MCGVFSLHSALRKTAVVLRVNPRSLDQVSNQSVSSPIVSFNHLAATPHKKKQKQKKNTQF